MRTARGLSRILCTERHIVSAALATAHGKRGRPDVAWFLFRLEREAQRIAEALASGSWRPRGFSVRLIRDPKPRAIARAPFEDRVVHTALVKLMEPVFLRSALPSDFACREGYGTARALLETQRLQRRHRFCMHLDIRAYFPSLDPERVLSLVERRVADLPFLEHLRRVLQSGAGLLRGRLIRGWLGLTPDWPPPHGGLPVGAHTSQFLATHVVLLELDHLIKRALKVPGYVRFVDDLLLFAHSRAHLRSARAAIGEWLWTHRGLLLKHPDAPVLSCQAHLDALGHRFRRGSIVPLPRSFRRFRARLYGAAHAPGKDLERLRSSLASSVHLLLGP